MDRYPTPTASPASVYYILALGCGCSVDTAQTNKLAQSILALSLLCLFVHQVKNRYLVHIVLLFNQTYRVDLYSSLSYPLRSWRFSNDRSSDVRQFNKQKKKGGCLACHPVWFSLDTINPVTGRSRVQMASSASIPSWRPAKILRPKVRC